MKGKVPGEIRLNDDGEIEVTCKDLNVLKITSLQMPGKNKVTSKDFVRGHESLLIKEKLFSFKRN